MSLLSSRADHCSKSRTQNSPDSRLRDDPSIFTLTEAILHPLNHLSRFIYLSDNRRYRTKRSRNLVCAANQISLNSLHYEAHRRCDVYSRNHHPLFSISSLFRGFLELLQHFFCVFVGGIESEGLFVIQLGVLRIAGFHVDFGESVPDVCRLWKRFSVQFENLDGPCRILFLQQ